MIFACFRPDHRNTEIPAYWDPHVFKLRIAMLGGLLPLIVAPGISFGSGNSGEKSHRFGTARANERSTEVDWSKLEAMRDRWARPSDSDFAERSSAILGAGDNHVLDSANGNSRSLKLSDIILYGQLSRRYPGEKRFPKVRTEVVEDVRNLAEGFRPRDVHAGIAQAFYQETGFHSQNYAEDIDERAAQIAEFQDDLVYALSEHGLNRRRMKANDTPELDVAETAEWIFRILQDRFQRMNEEVLYFLQFPSVSETTPFTEEDVLRFGPHRVGRSYEVIPLTSDDMRRFNTLTLPLARLMRSEAGFFSALISSKRIPLDQSGRGTAMLTFRRILAALNSVNTNLQHMVSDIDGESNRIRVTNLVDIQAGLNNLIHEFLPTYLNSVGIQSDISQSAE